MFLYSKWKIWKRLLLNAFENRGCTYCFCFLSTYHIVIWHFFKSGFLLVSRGLITATCDDLLSVLILDFSVGSGFPDHLCLLQTHLSMLSDTFFSFFFCLLLSFHFLMNLGFEDSSPQCTGPILFLCTRIFAASLDSAILFEKRAFLPI